MRARSAFVTLPLLNCMPGEPSHQNHTDCAASHSRSRTNRCCDFADCRQSIALDVSSGR